MPYHPVAIGSLTLGGNIFLAPVAGYSDRSFRSICVDCGASFTYTEMVSAEALVRDNDKTERLLRKAENETAYAVQIFGGNPDVIAKAAALVAEKTDCACIDINCGCPVPKIVKTGAGAALTKNPEKLYAVVQAAVRALEHAKRPVPVTVKIRSGWDDKTITWKEAADAALSAGVKAITMHPRTRAQGYEGKADWNALKELVSFVSGRVGVFGSGDLFSPEDARAMFETTGSDAVMFARGAMGNPFIFTKTKAFLTTGSYEDVGIRARIDAGFRELKLLVEDAGEANACKEMRKRFCAYTKGIPGGAELRAKLVHASSEADYRAIVSGLRR
ncbi:tRNA dihydrouridine synthase DusB [Treponema socranskii]|uniref:tRNA dihydrouridine synthase DusB n=1 Tax=Treponema socranskii TaxID=53419 RepID=UPI0028E97E9D|nr:tRNA dihydrouridine synthase DusB [Treponema socranskii]